MNAVGSVVIAGKLVVDEILVCVQPVLPGSNQRASARTLAGGGQVWHTARAVVRAGGRCTVTGWAGADPDSRELRDRLRGAGVHDLLVEAGRAVRSVVLVGPDGDRAIVSHGGEGHLSAEHLGGLDPLAGALVLHLDGFALDDVGGDALVALAVEAQARAVPVTLEPPSLARIAVLGARLGALPPLAAVLGRPEEVASAVDLLRTPPAVLVEHDGAAPVRVTTARGVTEVAVPPAAVDTTGAGDRFAGGWLRGMAAGAGPSQAVHDGIRAAHVLRQASGPPGQS